MIRCIVIDDEYPAIELLETYMARIPFLTFVAGFRSPLKAMAFLQEQEVDLIFLDINMPELSGISFLKITPSKSKVILTTAYAEYAVESYEYDVLDYLLKPISFERFLKSITKIQQESVIHPITSIKAPEARDFIFIKDGYDNIKVAKQDILFLKKEGNYIRYITEEKTILSRQTIQEALQFLGGDFVQIHKSYIINLQHLSAYDRQSVIIAEQQLPIGPSFKQMLIKKFN